MKKYYFDLINKQVFSMCDIEYEMRENQDYEISEEQFIEYLDKLSNSYDVECDVVDNSIIFTYKQDEESQSYLLDQINQLSYVLIMVIVFGILILMQQLF